MVQDWSEEDVPGIQAYLPIEVLTYSIIPFSKMHLSYPEYFNVSNCDKKLSGNKSSNNKYLESLDNQDKISDDEFNWNKDYIKVANDH